MNKVYSALIVLLLLSQLAFVIYVESHAFSQQPIVKTQLVKRAVHDTVYVRYSAPTDTVLLEIPAVVDTAAIVRNFFTQNIYVDTLHVCDYVDVAITDTVSCNQLLSHKLEVLSLPEFVSISSPPSAGSAGCAALGVIAGKNLMALKMDLGLKRHRFTAGYDLCNKNPIFGYSYNVLLW